MVLWPIVELGYATQFHWAFSMPAWLLGPGRRSYQNISNLLGLLLRTVNEVEKRHLKIDWV